MDGADLQIPKGFLTGICVPWGPMEGELAQPCICGYHTSFEDGPLALVQWHDGRLMFCHPHCIPMPEEDDA